MSTALCEYCGGRYYRSQLVRLPNGVLACRGPGTLNDAVGKDEVTLSRANAEHAKHAYRRPHPSEPGGTYDRDGGI